MLQQLSQEQNIVLGGDLRADSPGTVNHAYICPFFSNRSNEVGGSNNMEKEGLKRSLDLLRAHGVTFDSTVTDRHPQVQKFLREVNITQYFDVWHIEKGYACPPEYFVDCEYEAETTTVWSLSIVMYRTVCGRQPFTDQHDGLSFDSRVSTEEGVNEGGFLLPDDTSIAALIPKNSSQVLIIFSGEAVNRRPYYKQWICVSNISTL
ncbi:hypothetical protein ROHU_000772 [Labeo rohita]|uniref:Uncharacterized protein n=1 Tax=Labeo rohita TaxID=84645 RepID=A0A498P3N8_LABRO|nr:hypothetical protein ROHU_000772 [Labeo rohita]